MSEEIKSDEIDLTEIVRKLWLGRKTIITTTAVFLAIGIFLALISPKSYRSEATLLIETDDNSSTGMNMLIQQIAAASGINISQKQINDALTPDLYPVITTSTPFLLELSQLEITQPSTGKEVTVASYLEQYPPKTLGGILMEYTIGLPGKIIGLFKNKDTIGKLADRSPGAGRFKKYSPGKGQQGLKPVTGELTAGAQNNNDTAAANQNNETTGAGQLMQSPVVEEVVLSLTGEQQKTIEQVKNCITAEATSKSKLKTATPNMLTISVEVHDSAVAAQLTGLVVENLTRYITGYRTRKVRGDLEFINNQWSEAEGKYRRAQQSLAATTDRNQNILLATARTDAARRQSEFTLALNIFNTLSQLREQARIKVQENTPVFTIIEPPSQAIRISSGSKLLVIMVFLGIAAGVGLVFGKPVWNKISKQIKGLA